MSPDTLTLMGFGVGAVVVLWLAFSVLKKVVGLLLLAAVAAAGWLVWSHPELLQGLTGMVSGG